MAHGSWLKDPEQHNDFKLPKRRREQGLATLCLLLICSAIFVSLVFMTGLSKIRLKGPLNLTTAVPSLSVPTILNYTDCGNSRSEALARNCIFDPISFVWLPERCSDVELSSQFLSMQDWTWFLDKAGTIAAPMDEVLAGKHQDLFVTSEYHILHCTYMWRKMHRAWLNGTPMDGYIGNFHHTAHCEMMILKASRMAKSAIIDTQIRMKWPYCPLQ